MKTEEKPLDEWVDIWLEKFDEIRHEQDRKDKVKELIICTASQAITEYREIYQHSLN